MKKIGFYPNINKDVNLAKTCDLIRFVTGLGHDAAALAKFSSMLPNNCELMETTDELFKIADFIITLGGDGTILQAAQHAALTGIPLLGINLGHVGYLTDAEMHSAKASITKVLKGNFKIQNRMMLQACLGGAPYLALNDITIYRGRSPRLIQCIVTVNGEYMNTFRADGIIIATPTGSTAYNLAAGGPIIRPDTKMVVVTPISPHSLNVRPAVLSHEDIVSIRFPNNQDMVISADGEAIGQPLTYEGETEILISLSKYSTNIIKTNSFGFYEIMRMKFSDAY